MGDFNVGHFAGHRQQIIGQRRVQQLTGFVVLAVFVERVADTLDDAAADLFVDHQRVHDAAAIVCHPPAEQFDETGLDVDLDMRALHAVGDVVRRIGDVVAGHHQFRLGAARQRVLAEIADLGELGEIHPGFAGRGIADFSLFQRQRVGRGLQHRRGEIEDVPLQRLAGLQRGFAAHRHAARRPGAAAIGSGGAVAGDDVDIVHADSELVADDLGDAGQRPLPLVGNTGHHADDAGRFQLDGAAVLGGDAGARRAVIDRAEGGGLDEGRHPDAAPHVVFPLRRLFRPQAVVIHDVDAGVETPVQRHVFRRIAADAGQRIVFIAVIILPAKLDRIDLRLRGRLVDQNLGHGTADRYADATEHADDALVHVGHPRARMIIRQCVGRGGAGDRHHAFGKAEADIGGVGPDRQRVLEIHRGDAAVPVHAHLRRGDVIAGLTVGGERFQPVRGELHRFAQHFGDSGDGQFLAMDVDLQAEPAADIGRDDAHPVFGNAEMTRKHILHLVRRLVGMVYGQSFFDRIPMGQDRATFERHRRVTPEFEILFDRERRIRQRHRCVTGDGGVFETPVVAEIWMNRRRRRIQRLQDIHHGRQFLVLDDHQIGGVFRLGAARGDDGGDGFALVTGMIDRHGMLRRGFVTRPMRGDGHHGFAYLGDLGRRDDADHARRFRCHGCVDTVDPGVTIGAAHEGDVQHVGHGNVVGIASAPVNEPFDVGPRDPLADQSAGAVSVGRRHAPALFFMVSSTASTIA